MTGRRLGVWAALGLAATAGAMVALQSRYQGELGAELNNPYLATLISGVVGLIALLIGANRSRKTRGALRESLRLIRAGSIPLWALSGGLTGAFLVLAQSAAVAVIGVSVFAVASVAGQTIAGIVLDRFGFGAAERLGLRPMRMLGGLLAVAAVFASGLDAQEGFALSWLMVLPLAAGIGTGWQAAVNGRLRLVVGDTTTTTLLNFAVGCAALVIVTAVALLFTGFPSHWPTTPLPYLGGLFGVGYVALSAFVVRSIGVFLLGLTLVTGQLVAALVLDLFVPVGPGLAISVVVAIALSLAAVLVGAFPGRRT